jgi:hypothetical protein
MGRLRPCYRVACYLAANLKTWYKVALRQSPLSMQKRLLLPLVP